MSAAVGTEVLVATPAGPRVVPAGLRMVAALPGLPDHTAYALEALEETGTLLSLSSEPGDARPVHLFVAAPHAFFADYAPRVPADVLAEVVDAGTEPVVLVVVHPAGDGRDRHTANLLAPIVVDPASGRALQVVLDDDWPVRAPLG